MLLSDIVLRSMDRDAIEKEEDSYMDLGGGGPSGGVVDGEGWRGEDQLYGVYSRST